MPASDARPPLLSTPSSRPLMDDTSPAVTPAYEMGEDPFGTPGGSQRASTSSSAESSASAATPPVNPKIHINSVPNSPDPNSNAPSFTHPFAASGKSSLDVDSSAVSKSRSGSMRSRVKLEKPSSRSSKKPLPRSTSGNVGTATARKPFQSTRLKEEIYKPWLEKRDPAQRWAKWITIVCIILGVAIAAVICYDGYASIPNLGKTCLVLDDDFSTFNKDVWQHEVRLDGYGNGQFEWTTDSDNNTFVRDGKLYIVPTLTSDVLGEDAITNGYTLNLTTDGTCTSTNVTQCAAVSNSSLLTIINPVRSARIHTKGKVSIKYGKVEVKARMPTGDWIWPAIWMLPVNDTYGPWPRSGEIDIVESRGNNISYPNRGVDYAQSALHWGPTVELDRYWKTWGYRQQRRTYYNQEFHTYGLEWNDKYMWTYIDSKVSQVVSLRFKKDSFWTRGYFPSTIVNESSVVKLTNPWIQSENNVAPFDQEFYLIMNVAVGGTNGYFPDGQGSKPWVDGSGTSMSDFWIAKDRWWKTWPEDVTQRGMAVDSVKMWKTC